MGNTASRQGILPASAIAAYCAEGKIRLARAAGATFSFGSNGRYPKMGLLDYSLEMAHALELTAADLFTPPPGGCRAARAGV